jgi:hypothetical protein
VYINPRAKFIFLNNLLFDGSAVNLGNLPFRLQDGEQMGLYQIKKAIS